MLKKILVQNFILIDSLELNFDRKLNIITGETGSGKSILIGAIDAVLGAKVSKDVIKSGEEKAYIELTVIINNDLQKRLADNSIEYQNDDEVIISREITQTSSRYRVNGTLVNADLIMDLRLGLIDINSQHETYTLMQPKYHIRLLDAYASSTSSNLFKEYKGTYDKYCSILKQLEDAETKNDITANQIDFLKFQIEEIESAQIDDINEDINLESELQVLENAEKLKELTGSASWNLNNDDESVLSALSKIKLDLSKAVGMDSSLESIENNFIDAVELLKDISSSLRDYSQSLDNDTDRLNKIQERLFNLDKLKHKYGGSLEKVLDTLSSLQKEYSAIEDSTNNIAELQISISQTSLTLDKLADEISKQRKMYSEVLSSLVIEKLEKLELPKVKFQISVTPTQINKYGKDDVEFLISTNVSEPLMPLAKVASGGEKSRVMLALKTIFAQHDNIETVIFDEIDTGISGKTSQSVADEVVELSNSHQVIMITHQAIIASKANTHIYVKKVQGDSTKVGIYVLSDKDKLYAIAELASGEITDESLKFAKTLVKS